MSGTVSKRFVLFLNYLINKNLNCSNLDNQLKKVEMNGKIWTSSINVCLKITETYRGNFYLCRLQ